LKQPFGVPSADAPLFAEDVIDQRVVENPEVLDCVDQASHLVVRLLEESGVDLHLLGQDRLELGRHVVPRRDLGVAFGEFGVLRDDAQLLLLGQNPLAQHIPAVVELALVLVRPLLGHVVRGVSGARGEVHEERFVGSECLLLTHPRDGAIGKVLVQRVALFRRLLRLNRPGALEQARVVLVGLAADEAVEVLEARAGGPLTERADRGHLPHGHLVALAELARRIAVEP
jgi:hypothetical protein